MNRQEDERLLAASILTRILAAQGSLSSYLNDELKIRTDINGALVQEYCFGVCRWYHQLSTWADALLDKPLRKRDSDVLCLILLGLYQLFKMRTPAHAAVNETVAACRKLDKPWASGLVNAVLRQAQRREADLLARCEQDYSCLYSHPQWLLDRFKKDWPGCYRDILDANNARAPMTLRLNTQRCPRPDYLEQLHAAGLEAAPGRLADTAVVLAAPCSVERLPGFSVGLVSVQDEASQVLPGLLDLRPGMQVLDACAAPGGKACAMLEHCPGLVLTCLDNDARRLERVHDNLTRCGLEASVLCADLQQAALAPGSFERIVLDAPCSATGVIRRHPDIKLLRNPRELDRLIVQQQALLETAWTLLAPGGSLVYATCSTLRAENTDQIATFLAAHPEASQRVPAIDTAVTCEAGVQLLPQTGANDGFYYALLAKC